MTARVERRLDGSREAAIAIAIIAIPAAVVLPTSSASPGAQAAMKALALAVVASVAVCSHRRLARWSGFELALAAFAGAAIVSTLVTGSGLSAGGGVWLPAVCFVLAVRGARTCLGARQDAVEIGVAVAAVIVAGLAISELLGVQLPWALVRRPGSTLGNRNHVASYLLLCIPTLLAMHRRRWAVPVITAVVLVIVASRCRSVYVASFVIAVLAVPAVIRGATWQELRRPLLSVAFGVALGAAPWPGVQFAPSVADSAARMIAYDTGSGWARVQQHRVGLAALADQPRYAVAGFGAGTWERVASEQAHARGATPRFSGSGTPNSDILRVTVEQGVLGLALLVIAFVAALRAQRRIAPAATLVAAAICAAFDPLIIRPECVALLAVVIGAGAAPVEACGAARWRWFLVCAFVSGSALLRAASFCGAADIGRPAAYEQRAVRLAGQGRCAEAERALDRFIASSPFHWGARVEVARCFDRAGARTEALRVWRAAFRIEPHLRELVIATRKEVRK